MRLRNRHEVAVFGTTLVLGLAVLFLAHGYYGNVIRGTDADFPYALAHSFVFDRDADITNNLQLGWNPPYLDPGGDFTWANVPRRADGGFLQKWPIGLALVETPFLAMASALRVVVSGLGVPVAGPRGYSSFEQMTVAVGVLLIIVFALTLAYRYAADAFGHRPAMVGVAGCWLGTSLFYYTSVQPLWSHGLSFAALVALLGITRVLWNERHLNGPLILFGACIGMVGLVRPQQLLIAVFLLPVLVRVVLTRQVRDWAPGAAFGILLVVAAAVIQMAFNHSQFGEWTLNGYQAAGEHFRLGGEYTPYPMRVYLTLASPTRGLLVFSPVVAVASLAYLLAGRYLPAYIWPSVGNAIGQVFVIALWDPAQGESFGARMWADNSVVVVFGLALLIARAPRGRAQALLALVGLCLAVTTYLMMRHTRLIM